MGVFYADNMLDYDFSSVPNFRAALAVKGAPLLVQSNANMINSIGTTQPGATIDPDNRTWVNFGIGTASATQRGTESLLTVPIPDNTKAFYLSVRFRVVALNPSITRTLMSPFAILSQAPGSPAGNVPTAPFTYAFLDRNMALHAGATGTGESTNGLVTGFTPGNINLLEIYHAADGSIKIWLNEVPLTLPQTTKNRPNSGAIYIVCYSDGVSASGTNPGTNAWNVQFSDVVCIDPSTPGLQYRPGKTVRVETVSMSGDITKDWTADASQATHYGVMNLPWRGTVPATELLSAYNVGATERYQGAALRTDLGSTVHAVMIENQVANTAGAAHSLDFKAAFGGAAEAVLSTVTYPAGVGLVYNRQMLDKNPNGNADWTLASATSPKIAYTIKS